MPIGQGQSTSGRATRFNGRRFIRRTPARFATFVAVALTAGGLGLTTTGCGCPPNCPTPTTPSYAAMRVAGAKGATAPGDGGPAIAAGLSDPRDAVETPNGVFIAEFGAYRIRKVSGGVITTYAGTGVAGYGGDGGPATAAKFSQFRSIDADAAGNLYVADTYNHRIRRIATNGIVTTFAGTGVAGYGGGRLSYPIDVAADENGGVYIATGYTVQYANAQGGMYTVVGNRNYGRPLDGAHPTSQPMPLLSAIAYDKTSRTLYVAGGSAVYSVDTSAEFSARTIRRFAGTGTFGLSGYNNGGSPLSADLGSLNGLAVDTTGAVYIADGQNGVILRVKNNQIWWIAGNLEHDAGNGVGTLPDIGTDARGVYLANMWGIGARQSGYPGIYVPVTAYDNQVGIDQRVDSIYTTGSR